MTLRRLGTFGCVFLLLVATACTEDKPAPSPPAHTIERWSGAAADLRFRWSADPSVDLLNGPAVIVRAYTESVELAKIMFNADYVYPGFDRAVAPDGPDYVGPRPDLVYPPKHPPVGTDYGHILRIERKGRDVVALVCGFGYASAFDLGGGNVMVKHYANFGTSVRRVFMVAPAREPAIPLPPQNGPLPAPVDDVFGDWRVTATQLGLVPSDWSAFPADLEACIARAPDPIERRESLMTGEHSRADFPTLPPHPGWPSAAG
jgi:hypothetical protein